jgi:hypothetical protein
VAWGNQSGNGEGAVVGGRFGGLIPAILSPRTWGFGRNYWACDEAASGEGTRGLTRGLKREDMDALTTWLEDVHIRCRRVAKTLRCWPTGEALHAACCGAMSERGGGRCWVADLSGRRSITVGAASKET